VKHSITVLLFLLLSQLFAQGQLLPKPDTPAPALTYTQLLQAPEGAKANWPALRGRVVVLEFWATWCAPCVAEIPILNKLADSLDPKKVQFIAVDDEDPAIVKAFLKKRPISGWVMLDTSGEVFKRFGVGPRPTTIVIDTKGRVVSTSVRPERLRRDALLQLAMGRPATIESKADAKVDAEMQAAVASAMNDQVRKEESTADALFELSIRPGDDPQMTHIFLRGPGMLDIMNATPDTLLVYALGIPPGRVKVNGELAKTVYNLHLHAPSTDATRLADAIELAIESACGVKIEGRIAVQNVYLLHVVDKTKPLPNLSLSAHGGGFAFYDKKTQQIQLMNASVDKIAEALEESLGTPVINESGISARLMVSFPLTSQNFAAVQSALEKNTGLTLIPAKRPIETFTLTPNPAPNPKNPTATVKPA